MVYQGHQSAALVMAGMHAGEQVAGVGAAEVEGKYSHGVLCDGVGGVVGWFYPALAQLVPSVVFKFPSAPDAVGRRM
ncbi:hypothetical protein JCM19379_16530 [Methyloparacoccus murrellii]